LPIKKKTVEWHGDTAEAEGQLNNLKEIEPVPMDREYRLLWWTRWWTCVSRRTSIALSKPSS